MMRSRDIAKSPKTRRSVRMESWYRASAHGRTASATRAASPSARVRLTVAGSARPAWTAGGLRETRVASFFLAEEAPGPEDQDHAHHGVHDHHRRLGEVESAPRLGGAEDQAEGGRAADRAEAADHDDHEGVDDHADPHSEVRRSHGPGRHAAEPGQRARGAEDERADARDVGAEAVRHLAVLRDGADDQAGPGALQEEPHPEPDRDAEDHEEQPVARVEGAGDLDRPLQERRRLDALRGRAVEDAHALLEDERQPEGEQELVDRRPAVDEPERRGLQQLADG